MKPEETPQQVTVALNEARRRFDHEISKEVQVFSEGKICFEYKGQSCERWLVRIPPASKGFATISNITGTFVASAPGQLVTIDRSIVTRNSLEGNNLAEAELGKLMDSGYTLLERITYSPKYPDDLTDIEVLWEGEAFPELWRTPSLLKFREALAKADHRRRELEQSKAEALAQEDEEALEFINQEIAEQEAKIIRIRKRINVFSTAARLRNRFTLDGQQNKAKRLNALNGSIIIDGGPGTGKTTTLIHRVQYMLDTPALRESEVHFDNDIVF